LPRKLLTCVILILFNFYFSRISQIDTEDF